MEINQPFIVEQTSDYAVVFKPPKMHSVPGKQKNGDSLSEWFAEGELMHRLDYDTHGLVLFAKNQKIFEFFKDLQDKGEFIKEYSAVSEGDSGFPRIIMSYFRPFGPGRKQVRPVTEVKKHHEVAKDKGSFYRTEITDIQKNEEGNVFTVRIKRGFRHQIRCHLGWIDCPILNDPVYNPLCVLPLEDNYLALRAHALFFSDPSTGKKIECRIEKIMV